MSAPSDKPFQYIIYRDGQFRINKKISGVLKRLREPLHVISVVGKYRTGKSYFMNRLFKVQSENDGGFTLGSTIKSETKGIWGWLKKIDGKTFLLIDTEGLYDPHAQGVNFDNKIISLSLLLGSTFILNTTGTIDRASICQLEFVVALTKSLKAYASQKSKISDYKIFFPNFIWLVRDFFLEMKTDEGLDLSDDQYLDEMLRISEDDLESLDSEVQQLIRTKKYIKEMFPKRKCFTLVQPVPDSKNLHRIHELDYSSLEPNFTKKMDRIVNYLHNNVKSKEMFGKTWTGRIFYEMSKLFVDHINSEKFLTMDTSFSSVVSRNNEKIEKEAITSYVEEMNAYIFGQKKVSELKDLHKRFAPKHPPKKRTQKQVEDDLKKDQQTIMDYLAEEEEELSAVAEGGKKKKDEEEDGEDEDEEDGDRYVLGGGGQGFPMDYENELFPLHETIFNFCMDFLAKNVYEQDHVSIDEIKQTFKEKVIVVSGSGIPKKKKKGNFENFRINSSMNISGGVFFEKYYNVNLEKSEEKCEKFLKQKWKKRIDDNFETFAKSGEKGYSEFMKQKEKIKNEYFSERRMGPCRDRIFKKFMEDKKQDEEKIRAMSNFILEKSRRIEQLESEIDTKMTEIEDLQKKVHLDRKKLKSEKKKQDEERKKMEADMEKKRREMEEELERQKKEMEKKLKEQEELAKKNKKCGCSVQ